MAALLLACGTGTSTAYSPELPAHQPPEPDAAEPEPAGPKPAKTAPYQIGQQITDGDHPSAGVIQGTITEIPTAEPILAATVVLTSPELQASQDVISYGGRFEFVDLPPGIYELKAYYGAGDVTVSNIRVDAGKITPVVIQLDPSMPDEE